MARGREPYCQWGAHLTDTILVIEDVEIPVHRKMLSVLSSYFKNMFSDKFKESKETRIVLKEVHLDTFYDCLDIMHGVDLEYTPGQMCSGRLDNLLMYTERFGIDSVRMFCQWEMKFETAGHEVERYLMACHYELDENIKERLFPLLTTEKLTNWTQKALDGRKTAVLTLDEKYLARLLTVSTGKMASAQSQENENHSPKESKIDENDCSPDAIVEVDGKHFPVYRSVMCYLSPFFYNLFDGSNNEYDMGAVVKLEEVKAETFRDCLSIIQGKPISMKPGDMPTSRLFDLLDVSTRLGLSPVRVFCSMEMALPTTGKDLERYLLACHFKMSCKTMLLSRIESSNLTDLDVESLTSQLPMDQLHLDLEDVRSLLASACSFDLSPVKHTTAVTTGETTTTTLYEKSALSDVVIVVGETEFHVNRMMMASLSPYFYRVFVLEDNAQRNRVDLEGVEAPIFDLCLHIIHGKMPETYERGKLSSSYMIGLLEYSHRFELAPVKLFCDHEVFVNEKGHKMDLFLTMSLCYPEETETLLSNLTTDDIIDWFEKNTNDSVPRAQCSVRLSLQQLDRLLKLTGGKPLADERSSIRIRPSSLSKTALSDASKKVYLTITNKGMENIVLEIYGRSFPVKVERYSKVAAGETVRLLVESTNNTTGPVGVQHVQELLVQIFPVKNVSWDHAPHSIRRLSSCVSNISIPIVE